MSVTVDSPWTDGWFRLVEYCWYCRHWGEFNKPGEGRCPHANTVGRVVHPGRMTDLWLEGRLIDADR